MSFEHIKKLNELMGNYTSALNRVDMLKKDLEKEENVQVKEAFKVLIQHHLAKARTHYMSVQEEIHKYFTTFDS